MGLLDRVKRAAGVGSAPPADDGAAALKRKYQGALQLIEVERVRVLSLHVESGALYLKGMAPTSEARERILAAIREAGAPGDRDIVADITVV
ncbi:MAG: hypothetical protein ACMG6S_29850 [Byssovorax sp.]